MNLTRCMILAAAICSISGQSSPSCGCSQQPTVIQISCGGTGTFPGVPLPPAPAPAPPASNSEPDFHNPPPPDANTEISSELETNAGTPGESVNYCEPYTMEGCYSSWGYIDCIPEGGFPDGYTRQYAGDCDYYFEGARKPRNCSELIVLDDPNFPWPPENWDGHFDSLGFDLQPGTKEFNAYMCWPIRTGPSTQRTNGFVSAAELPYNVEKFQKI